MGLFKLYTRDSWCKHWPTRDLVHHVHSLPELLGLWSKDWSSLKMEKQKVFWPWDCLHVLNGSRALYKR